MPFPSKIYILNGLLSSAQGAYVCLYTLVSEPRLKSDSHVNNFLFIFFKYSIQRNQVSFLLT